MAKKKTLLYTIHLRDQALVDAINAQLTSPTGGPLVGDRLNYSFTGLNQYLIWRAPLGAADEYAINAGAFPPALPIVEAGGAIPSTGIGYITSEWFTTSNTFPRNVATFTISSGWWIFGSSTKFYWGAEVVFAPANAAPVTTGPEPTDPAPIPQRRQLMGGDPASGFELTLGAGYGLGVLSGDSLVRTRAASRKIDGFGMAHVLGSGSARNVGWQYNSSFPSIEWHRFYVNQPEAPDVTTQIFDISEVAVSSRGFAIAITGSMNVALFYQQPTQVLAGTFGPTLTANKWYKFDVIYYIDAAGDTMYLDVWLNGALIASINQSATGLIGNRVISNSRLGKAGGASLTTTSRVRFDSWIFSDPPQTRDRSKPQWNIATPYVTGDIVHVGTDPGTWNTYRALVNNTGVAPGPASITTWRKLTDPFDWLHGSHLQWIKPKGFGATHGAWTGDWRVLAKAQLFGGSIGTQITSSVSGALAAVLMDTEIADGVDGALGWVAMEGAWVVSAGGVPDGQFGYKIGSDAPVLATVVQGAGFEGHTAIYRPSGLTAPLNLGTPIELHHTKAADATAANMAMCQAVMELVGVFGEEDLDPNELPAPHVPQAVIDRHNVHIPRSPWANQPNAMGPVIIVSGTYVGNGTGQDIAFKVPPCFVHVRPSSGDTGGCFWMSSAIDSHTNFDQGTYLFGIGPLAQDFSFVPGSPTDDQQMRWLLRLCGGGTQINAAGVTYTYIAFCDPAKRFALGHSDHAQQTVGLPRTFNLPVSTWQPEWLFAQKELIGSATANEIYTRFAAAYGTDSVKNVSGASLVSNAIETNVGNLVVKAGFVNADFDQLSFLGFRRHDGNNDPNEHKVMFMGSYTGDGSASRTVSLAPSTGLRPMWAIVAPDNAAAIYRDVSNTTNTSNQIAGGTTATGITGGGIDSFSVGSTLNANGIQYTYFGFWGSATAGNGGWSTPTENVPVITEPPVLPDILDEPVEVPTTTPSGPVITNEPDLEDDTPILDDTINVGGTTGGQTCEFYTRELMNIALQHVGISKVITSLTTEQSEAAAQARRFVRKDVNAVLRDYPWDFATLYQDLVLQSGSLASPVNNDWTFAYYAPNAMMLARRIAKVEKGRKFDPEPVAFREGLLAGRPVIFCNVEATTDVPLVLEYTTRQTCPAFYGDALFREALTWKFAASFAMTLARDKDKQIECLKVYNSLLPKAKVVDANEQQQEPPGDAEWILGR